jgi:hypothetical protein
MMLRFSRFFLFLSLILVSLGAYFWVGRVTLLERYLTKRFNQEVTIEDVSVRIDHLDLKNWKISGQAQSYVPYALQGKILRIELTPLSFFTFPIRIPNITIKDPILTVELYNIPGSENNWTTILNQFSPAKSRRIEIDTLNISNLQFEIYKMNGKKINTPPIPLLQFEHLGQTHKLTFHDLGRTLCEAMLTPLTNRPQFHNLLDHVEASQKEELKYKTSKFPLVKQHFLKTIETIKQKAFETKEFLQGLFRN